LKIPFPWLYWTTLISAITPFHSIILRETHVDTYLKAVGYSSICMANQRRSD